MDEPNNIEQIEEARRIADIKKYVEDSKKPKEKENTQKIIKKIDELIRKVNNTTIDGSSKQYIMGGSKKPSKMKNNRFPRSENRNYNFMDPQTGLMYISQSPTGYSLENQMYKYNINNEPMHLNYDGMGYDMPYLSYAGQYGAGMVGGARKKRKPRSDKGKPRQNNEWQKMVKAVASEFNIPYNKALKKASELKKDGYTYKDFE